MVSIAKDKPVTVTPIGVDRSACPGLQFMLEVVLNEYPYEILLQAGGFLLSEDNKILATLSTSRLLEPAMGVRRVYSLEARDPAHLTATKPMVEKVSLIAWLNEKVLDEINSLRERRGGDVFLKILLDVLVLRSSTILHHTTLVEPEQYGLRRILGVREEGVMVSTYYDKGFSSSKINLWLLSGYGGPEFLNVDEYVDSVAVEIPESRWVRDFMPKLGMGTYFIVEVPAGGVLNEAWSLVRKAEEAFYRWDTKGVFANCREVGHLLDRLIKLSKLSDFVKNEKWGRAYSRFEHFASLDLHLEDIKKTQRYPLEDIKIGREDCVNLLIATKSLIKYAEDLGIR
jgi:hypothetical protein